MPNTLVSFTRVCRHWNGDNKNMNVGAVKQRKLVMRVLISGGGIAGPTLAWFLAQAGARITIVKKSHSLLPHGQNVDIHGSARTVIKKMGTSLAITGAYVLAGELI